MADWNPGTLTRSEMKHIVILFTAVVILFVVVMYSLYANVKESHRTCVAVVVNAGHSLLEAEEACE